MKKISKFLAIALAATSLFAFSACGDSDNGEKPVNNGPSINVPKDEFIFDQISAAEQEAAYASFQTLFSAATDGLESMDKLYTQYSSTMEAINSSLLHAKLDNVKEVLNASCLAKWEAEIPAEGEAQAVPEVFEYAYQTIADSKAVMLVGTSSTLIDYDVSAYQYVTNGTYYQKQITNAPAYGANNQTVTDQYPTTASIVSQFKASLPSVKVLDIISEVLGDSYAEFTTNCSNVKLYKNEAEHAYKISFDMNALSIGDLVRYCSYNPSAMLAQLRQYNIDPNTVRASYNLSYTIVLDENNQLTQIKGVILQKDEAAEGYKKLFNGFIYHETATLHDSLTINFPSDLSNY